MREQRIEIRNLNGRVAVHFGACQVARLSCLEACDTFSGGLNPLALEMAIGGYRPRSFWRFATGVLAGYWEQAGPGQILCMQSNRRFMIKLYLTLGRWTPICCCF
jgi:hypothetical protein